MLAEHRPVPKRGGETKVPRRLAQIGSELAPLCRIESAGPTGSLSVTQSVQSALLKAVDPALYRGAVFTEQFRHLPAGLTGRHQQQPMQPQS